jgi:DNA adenine methylase
MPVSQQKRIEGDAPQPALKWAGGKRWLLPELRTIYAGHTQRRLVEPFVGGLAVALGLMPKRAVLNDLNPHLINFYKQLQKGLPVRLAMHNDRDHFYAARDRFNKLILDSDYQGAEAAQLFYYLNRTAFNGLCRFNSKGLFNVPFGRYKTINYREDFSEYTACLRNWRFTQGDFERIPLADDDFLYADPPYDVEFTRYSQIDFKWEDQIRLAEWLAAHKGPVLISNQATPRVQKLYRGLGFRLKILSAPRLISCTGDRSRAHEVLALKNLD